MKGVDVVVVGAGPAGIGMAMALNKISGLDFGVLESQGVGASFQNWPAQTRFITPSFNSNPYGLADLNSVDALTSPAAFSQTQHLNGQQYAEYLFALANAYELPVLCDCKVLGVSKQDDGGFLLDTEQGELKTKFLIWACGEFQFPDLEPFPGGRLCWHYSKIADWQALDDSAYTVIGGYESGIDATYNLIKQGCHVSLLVRSKTWDRSDTDDPSIILSPYSCERLRDMMRSDQIELVFDVDVIEVTETETGYRILSRDGRIWDTSQPPILGTGFMKGGGAQQIKDLWMWDEDGHVMLSELDESLHTPGLFLVGPQVRHDARLYCFIYKFRQRFESIAQHLARQLRLNIDPPIGAEDGVWGPFGNSECCEGCEC